MGLMWVRTCLFITLVVVPFHNKFRRHYLWTTTSEERVQVAEPVEESAEESVEEQAEEAASDDDDDSGDESDSE